MQLLLEMLVSGDGGLGIDTALRHPAAARNAGQWDESVVQKLERLIALFNIEKSCCGDYFVL